MQWANDLLFKESAAQTVLVISLVAIFGLALGSIKYKGLGLGIAGVLFVGLSFGHLGVALEPKVLEFCREFGLILFVYTIGMQVGPGFFSSLKKQGLPLNIMAAVIVLGGAAMSVGLWYLLLGGTPSTLPSAIGLLAGATTNTPSMGAGEAALRATSSDIAQITTVGQAYAVAYPFGILGIILAMLVTKWVFRISVADESKKLADQLASERPKLENLNLEVHNPNLVGIKLRDIPLISPNSTVISRIYRQGKSELARPDSTLALGDVIHAVGIPKALTDLKMLVGAESKIDVRSIPSHILAQRLLVSQKAAIGKSLAELAMRERLQVNITRIHRNGVDLPVGPTTRLFAGDYVTAVGDTDGLARAAIEVGNSPKQLNTPHVIGVFLGIALGVFIGSIPFFLPGLPAPVKLGLAGGPLIVAIVLSYLGRLGPVIYYMPMSANLMMREIGIVMFLACVGVKGGHTFIATLQANGLIWLGIGALITFVPLIVIALIARGIFKLNYLTLCGLLAGSMTDPPALSFAGAISGSDAPSVSYATVYPMVMLLRVLSTQAIVLILLS
jgi:putative transport protein